MVIPLLLTAMAQPPELTVYNGGFALVKEVREMNLSAGRQTVAVSDVAQQIEPTSVAIRSINAPGSFTVLEQNYRYDLISVQAILAKAAGQRIWLNRILPNGAKERLEGTLMSAPFAVVGSMEGGSQMTYNGMVMRLDDGRILLNPTGEVEVASIPEGLISTPSLFWELEASKAGTNQVELSYLTQGISWTADYTLSLDKDGKLGDLKGWVSMNNRSGATFKDAKLKLLAGEVQRAQPPMNRRMEFGMAMDAAAKSNGFAEETFADYHLYTLQRPATVANNEIKQISLLEAFRVPVVKKLVLDWFGNPAVGDSLARSEGTVGGTARPQVRIEFVNDEKSKLGMPLPEGTFKVFQHDSSGSVQLLGEDRIQHTPKKEKLSLVVGRAFDIVAERKQTTFEWIGSANNRRGTRRTIEIEVRNRKNAAESVTILERHGGQWKVLKTSQDWVKLDSNTMQYVVNLKPDETKTVIYTVETTW